MKHGRIYPYLIALASLQAIPAHASEADRLTVAVAEGYARQPCVSGVQGGAMGVHYVNAEYLQDDGLDATRPEALIYEPQSGGGMELVGAEFIAHSDPATLDGHLLHHVGAPNRYGLDAFYELHVWAWRENPKGDLADFNPAVSCEAQPAKVQGSGD